MAVTSLGNQTIDFDLMNDGIYPSFPVTAGNGYLVTLQTNPLAQTLNFGYLLVFKSLQLGTTIYELGDPYRWYPKGGALLYVLPIPASLPPATQGRVFVRPVERYPGAAQPRILTISASYEDTLVQPLGFGIQ